MPTFNQWIGNALAVAQVTHLTPENLAEGVELTVTMNGKANTYTVLDTDVEDERGVIAAVCENFAAQLTEFGQTVPEFGEVTWAGGGNDDGETNYQYIVATGPEDGTPFELTTSTSSTSGVTINVLVLQHGSAGQNEIQEVDLGTPAGGTFQLDFNGQDTSSLSYAATAYEVRDALCALSNIGGTDEVQTVTITGTPAGGDFTLTYSGQTTAGIAYNAAASAVQSALEALSNIGVGDVVCTGGPLPGAAVTVTFRAALGRKAVAEMTASGAGLTGGTAPAVAIATTTAGVDSDVTVTGSAGGPWTIEFVNSLAAQDVSLLLINSGSLTGGTLASNRREVIHGLRDGWTNARFTLTGHASVSAGTFDITFTDSLSSATWTATGIAYNATVREVIEALRTAVTTAAGTYKLVSSEHTFGTVAMNTATAATGFTIELISDYSAIAVSVDSSGLTGGTYSASATSGGGVLGLANGTYRLKIGSSGTWSSSISEASSASMLEAVVEAMPEVGSGNVTVTSLNVVNQIWGGFELEFVGDLAGVDLDDIQIERNSGSGWTAYSSPQTEGSSAAVNPQVTVTQVGIAARNEQQRVSLAESAASGTFTLTWNPGSGNETTTTIAYNASASTVQSALEGLATPAPGDFTVTGSAGGPWTVEFDGTYAETNVNTMTGNGASLVAANPSDLVETEETAASGPNFINVAKNWSAGTVPVDSEWVVFSNSNISAKFGLSNASIDPEKVIIDSTFTGEIGLPKWNPLGYWEYRQTELQIGTDGSGPSSIAIEIGEGDGEGSPLIRLNTGGKQVVGTVKKTGSSSESGVPSLCWRGTHASNTWDVLRGSMGIGYFPGQAATVATLRMTYIDAEDSDADVRIGDQVTLGTVIKTGGSLHAACAITSSFTNQSGDATIIGSGAVNALDIQGGEIHCLTTGIVGDYGAITGASAANPCVITSSSHGLTTGDKVRIASIVGMTELNQREFTVVVVNSSTFQLAGENSSAYTAYSSGGYWSRIGSVKVSGEGILNFGRSLVARQVGPAIDLYGADARVIDTAKRLTTLTYGSNEFALHYHYATPVADLGTDFIHIRKAT